MKLNAWQVRLISYLARGERGNGRQCAGGVFPRTPALGFTLIELLVVVAIVSILAGLALPSFLNQINRARAAEAATYTGTINRAQQAHRLENPEFASSLEELAIGIPEETSNFQYSIQANEGVANAIATPLDDSVAGMLGVTYIAQVSNGEATTVAFVCRSDTPGETPAPYGAPPPENQCPGGSTKL